MTKQKAKALLVIIVFVALIILPVCYAMYREKMAKDHIKKEAPQP